MATFTQQNLIHLLRRKATIMEKRKYLGETNVDWKETPRFKDYTTNDWILYFIDSFYCDGDHHSKWLIDQIARIANGCPINVKIARWDDGLWEYRVSIDDTTEAYDKWLKSMKEDIEDYEDKMCPP